MRFEVNESKTKGDKKQAMNVSWLYLNRIIQDRCLRIKFTQIKYLFVCKGINFECVFSEMELFDWK